MKAFVLPYKIKVILTEITISIYLSLRAQDLENY